MISIEECRELMPNDIELTDKQVGELRSDLYELAELALDDYFKKKSD